MFPIFVSYLSLCANTHHDVTTFENVKTEREKEKS